jgi:hypothetical protein
MPSLGRFVALSSRGIFGAFLSAVALLSVPASAADLKFDFNSLSVLKAGTTSAQEATIQTYVQGVLDSTFGKNKVTVTVTGAMFDYGTGSSAVGANGLGYNGEGYVVGPVTGTTTKKVIPLTLGDTDGCTAAAPGCNPESPDARDGYIHNVSGVTDSFTIKFTGLNITGAGFDWEIFPDASCPNYNTCTTKPDFNFKANNTTLFSVNGVGPGQNSTYTQSINSGTNTATPEKSAQALGTGLWNFAGNQNLQNQLDFVDWPATIGIDNLDIYYTPPVPEPASVLLLVTVLLSVCILARKRLKVS